MERAVEGLYSSQSAIGHCKLPSTLNLIFRSTSRLINHPKLGQTAANSSPNSAYASAYARFYASPSASPSASSSASLYTPNSNKSSRQSEFKASSLVSLALWLICVSLTWFRHVMGLKLLFSRRWHTSYPIYIDRLDIYKHIARLWMYWNTFGIWSATNFPCANEQIVACQRGGVKGHIDIFSCQPARHLTCYPSGPT